jgi:hypothetical protein
MSDSTDMNRPGVSSGKGESDSRTDSTDSLTSNQIHPHEPPVPPIASSSPSAWSSAAELDSIWESMVKVTLASFGGSLVGLALENQRRQHHPHPQQPLEMGDRPATRRRPPTRLRQPPSTRVSSQRLGLYSSSTSLPGQWALSCLFFAMAMEASRHASPTTLLLKVASSSGPVSTEVGNRNHHHPVVSPTPCYRTVFLTSFGDYAIGGAVSGMAGGWALASRQPPSSLSSRTAPMAPMGSSSHAAPFTRRAGLVWGLRVGLALGVAAGLVQAAVDVAGLYYDATQQHPRPATVTPSSSSQQEPAARGASVEEGAEQSER